MPRRRSFVLLALPPLAVLAALACAPSRPAADASGASPAPAAAPRPAGQPFANLAGERVIVVPIQRLRLVDSAAGTAPAAAGDAASLAALDSAVAIAATDRGARWAFARDVARSARRNPTYAPDPYRLPVSELLPGRKAAPDGMLSAPLASQLRTLVALNDGRYVVVPAELRVERAGPGTTRAVLRLALVDARAAQMRWVGEVGTDAAPATTPSIPSTATAQLAARFADLIAAP
jgi:hypothetical protein